MLVYGKNVAFDLLKKNNKNIKKVILEDNFRDKNIISLIENKKLPVERVSKKKIDDLCLGVHQGIILDVLDYQYLDFYQFIDNSQDDFIVMLDHLEDPHNLGAIIRTCEAAGVKHIIIPKARQVLINSTVMKVSVGCLDNVDIVLVSNLGNAIDELKKRGYWIVGTKLEDSVDYRDIDYSGKICLIIGNEGSGISQLVSKKCDFLAKIPMYGKTNSLNASVAAGIMIYEIIRNRK